MTKKRTAEAEVEVKPSGKTGVSVRVSGIQVKDDKGNVVRTIKRRPRRRFGDDAQTR